MCVYVGEVSAVKKVDMWHTPKGRMTVFQNPFGKRKCFLKVITKAGKLETPCWSQSLTVRGE